MFTPISGKHSISKVIANIFLPQGIIRPDNLFNKLQEKNALNSYQKKGISRSQTINFNQNILNISDNEISGFVCEEFSPIGKSINVLKVENVNGNSKSQINFECREYDRWQPFRERFYKDVNEIAKDYQLFVEAISLNYVDEFIWNSPENIPIKEIFDEHSEFLNSSFYKSHNGTIVLISQSAMTDIKPLKEEKIEILFNNDIKRVIVNHTVAIKPRDIKIFTEEFETLSSYFEEAHSINKDLLKNILTQKTQNIIGLC